HFRQNAQAFHPHLTGRHGYGRAVLVRPEQGAHHLPGSPASTPAGCTRCEAELAVPPQTVAPLPQVCYPRWDRSGRRAGLGKRFTYPLIGPSCGELSWLGKTDLDPLIPLDRTQDNLRL